jgi:hypothetical protein
MGAGEWSKRGVRFRYTPRLKRIKYEPPVDQPPTEMAVEGQKPVWGGVFTRFEDIDGNSFSLVSFDSTR